MRLILIVVVVASNVFADGLRVVTTGDSITNGYSNRLQATYNAHADRAQVFRVASGGNHSERYTGHEIDPTTGTIRDYAAEVLSFEPDVIVFMLGTNDAFKYVVDPNWLNLYIADLDDVFRTFRRARNRHGRRPIVIVATVLPVLLDANINVAVDDIFNPWLVQAVDDAGFVLVDTNALIQEEPNWQDFYSDGIHLWADNAAGYWWLAETLRNATVNNLTVRKSRVR